MTISVSDCIKDLQVRFNPSDLRSALQLVKLGYSLGYSNLNPDDYHFMLAVLYDLRLGLDLTLDSLKEL